MNLSSCEQFYSKLKKCQGLNNKIHETLTGSRTQIFGSGKVYLVLLNSNFAVEGKLTIHFVIINQVEEFNPCKAISLTVRMKSYSKTYRPSL